jgi:hypothetical protein
VLENVDNTISGAGQVFQNAGMILKNDTAGVIDATGASPLSIGTFNANPVQNTGLLETTAGTGGLIITGGTTIDNTGNSNAGKITADGAGTHVDISNSTILGGTLTGKNGGVFNGSGSTLDGSTAGAPVTIAAGTVLNYGNSTTNFLVGTINNHGTIAQSSVANLTDLIIAAGGATLTGGGSLVLSNNGNNRVYANTAATVLDNVDNTISGAGQIFPNAGLSLVNSGLVDANVSTPLVLSLNTTNNASGILRGSGAGGLAVSAGATTNNGTVEALNGSAVTFNGSSSITNNAGGTLPGGTWRAVSTGAGATVSLVGGTITTDAANLILDGAGSKIQAGTAGSYTDIQNTLTGVAPGGQLHVLNGQNYTTNSPSGSATPVWWSSAAGPLTDASFNTGSLSASQG